VTSLARGQNVFVSCSLDIERIVGKEIVKYVF